jgi:hypothetical protein
MQRIGINTHEKRNVRHVGYLQELNRDARSTEHKTPQNEVVGYIMMPASFFVIRSGLKFCVMLISGKSAACHGNRF